MKIETLIKSTRPLDLSKKTILNIIVAQNQIQENMNLILKAFDISSEQYNVLRILRGQKGKPANMSVIQERMLNKSSNTTRLVDKLLLKNLVTRCECPDNRRKIEVSITDRGLEILKSLDKSVENHEKSFSEKLEENELQTLNDLLEKYRS